jgi:hypothetical protein
MTKPQPIQPDLPKPETQVPSPAWWADVLLGVKLLFFSTALAVAIKTLGPSLALPATTPVVLFLILFPSVGMGLIFLARQRLSR